MRWYQSRSNQAALIGGVALIVATAVGSVIAVRGRSAYPVLEVKDLTPGGEQTLARLALSPTKQLIDSAGFARLSRDDLLWNDSLGVAIRKPSGFEWGMTKGDSLEVVSLADGTFFHWLFGIIRKGFARELESNVRFFGVRLDQPTRVGLTAASQVDSTVLGVNPFKDASYFVKWIRGNGGDPSEIPLDSLAQYQREAIAELDSITAARFPVSKQLATGVFVARVGVSELPAGIVTWAQSPTLDRTVSVVAVGAPSLLVIDRDRKTALFSVATRMRHIQIDGRPTAYATLNRAGYAIERGKYVYVVMLQYMSTQPSTVLEELQRILESVRLRVDPR